MANLVIGYDDRVATGTVTVSSELVTLPGVNLQTKRVGMPWRTQPGVTSASVLVDFGASKTIGAVMLAGVNLSAAATWRVRLSTVDATGAAGNAYDSGSVSAGVDVRFRMALRVTASDVTGRYLKVDLSDASLPYIEAGRLAALRLWRPQRNFSFGMSRPPIDLSKVTKAENGEAFVLRGNYQRSMGISLQAVFRDELLSDAEDLMRTAGTHDDVQLCLDPSSDNLGYDSIWGLQEAMPAWELATVSSSKASMRIVERM